MVVKVEAEPTEVTASDFLNINLAVSPPATSIYFFFNFTFPLKDCTDFKQKKALGTSLRKQGGRGILWQS